MHNGFSMHFLFQYLVVGNRYFSSLRSESGASPRLIHSIDEDTKVSTQGVVAPLAYVVGEWHDRQAGLPEADRRLIFSQGCHISQ